MDFVLFKKIRHLPKNRKHAALLNKACWSN